MSDKSDSQLMAEWGILNTIDLQAAATWMIRQVVARLDELQAEIAGLVAEADPGKLSRGRKGRLKQLMADIEERIQKAYAEIDSRVGGWLDNMAQAQEERHRHALVAIIGGSVGKPDAVDVAAALVMGATVTDWLSRQAGDLLFRAKAAVTAGADSGEDVGRLVNRIMGTPGGKEELPQPDLIAKSKAAAEQVLRSAVQAVDDDVAEEVAAQFEPSKGVRMGFVSIAVLDSRTTELCRAYAFKLWTLDLKPVGHSLPFLPCPRHWGCLLGDSVVAPSGKITGVTKRFFDGKIVRLRTRAGHELACTPNHPVLTQRGWVAAQLLNQGDSVVSYLLGQNPSVAKWQDQHGETRFEELFESFALKDDLVFSKVPTTAPDFHGDGAGSEVAVVGTNGGLPMELEAARHRHLEELILECRRPEAPANPLTGLGSQGSFARCLFAASRGQVRTLKQSQSFGGRGDGHTGQLLLASVPQLASGGYEIVADVLRRAAELGGNTSYSDATLKKLQCAAQRESRLLSPAGAAFNTTFRQDSQDNGVTDAELGASILCGKTGLVEFDHLVRVDVSDFSGHVFNMETTDHFYVAQGIITHNCRSHNTATVLDDAKMDLTFKGWMDTLSAKDQDEIFGAGRMRQWRDGKLSDAQLVRHQQRAISPERLRTLDPRLPKD